MEVGPGLGVMTAPLLARAGEVFAIEIDPALCFCGSALPRPIFTWSRGCPGQDLQSLIPGPYMVVANLPYYITSPFLIKLLEKLPSGGHNPGSAGGGGAYGGSRYS